MTDAGWASNGPDFLEQARVLVLKMNEIQPDQWDECDEADQKHIAKALQASHQAGRAQGRVEGLREGLVKIQERVDFYAEQEQQSQGPIRAGRGLQRNEASGCAEELARLIEQAAQGESCR